MTLLDISQPLGAPPIATTAEIIDAYPTMAAAARHAVEMIFLAAAVGAIDHVGHAAPVAELITAPELRSYWIERFG